MLKTGQEKALRQQVSNAVILKEMLDSEAWKEIVEPMLENEIVSIVGGKTKEGYTMGRLNSNCKKDETIAYYIGAKDALVSLYNRIAAIIQSGQDAKDILSKKPEKRNMFDIQRYEKG